MQNAIRSKAGALTLALLGVGVVYSLPFFVFPPNYTFTPQTSLEVLNLFCITAWMGQAHFLFAFQGQFFSKSKLQIHKGLFVAGLAIALTSLFFTRSLIGQMAFNLLTWIYFIPHFIHAESFFDQPSNSSKQNSSKLHHWLTALGFGYFSFVLFLGGITPYFNWVLPISAIATSTVILTLWKRLNTNPIAENWPLYLALFFVAEGLIWGTYIKYMHPLFQSGLYTFHVAIASLFHYIRSYQFALNRTGGSQFVTHQSILGINLVVIILGSLSLFFSSNVLAQGLNWVLNPQHFTVWVVLHLIASDAYNKLRLR